MMKSGNGLYKRALAVGLTKILNEYREAISEAEIRFVRDASLSVLELRHFLSRHFELIPILNATVNSIKRRDLKGLQISDFLYVQSRLGSPIAKECFEKLLQHCHRVMFNQMISWLLHGELVDYYGEFFVEERHHVTTSFDARKHSGVVAEYEWKHQHRLKFSMLPRSFLPARLAEKILFVGKAVHIVRRSSSVDWRSQSQENMYAKMFLSLRDHPQLRIMDLEQAVDRVQNFMATQLLQLILLEGHLGGAALGLHLKALRDTFLLGDGHFFSVFIESSLDVMKRAATHHSERDLNLGAWRHACTHSELNPIRRKYFPELRLDLSEFKFQEFKQNDFDSFEDSPKDLISSSLLRLLGSATLHKLDTDTDESLSAMETSSKLSSSSSSSTKRCSILLGTPPDRLDDPFLPGVVWTVNKKRVCEGFEMSCTFRAGDESRGLAFVIQNYGALSVGSMKDHEIGHHFPRSISVVLDWGDLECGVSVWIRKSSEEKEESSKKKKKKMMTTKTRPRKLCVKYEPAEKTTSVVHRWKLCVFLDDEKKPLMEEIVDLASEIGDNCGNGSAWIGFTGSVRSSASASSEDALQLLSWNFASLLSRRSNLKSATSTQQQQHVAESWRQLSMTYHVPWPLHLIVSQMDLELYNALFCFLFTTKRVGTALDRAWIHLNETRYRVSGGVWNRDRCRLSASVSSGRAGSDEDRKYLLRLQLLRTRMQFLIDNLQYYLQVDVVEASFSKMQRALSIAHRQLESIKGIEEDEDDKENMTSKQNQQEERDVGGAMSAFRGLQRAHKEFLSSLTRRTFIQVKSIRDVLYDVLGTCLNFSTLIDAHAKDVTSIPEKQLQRIEKSFKQLSMLMLMLLRRSSSHQALLSRLTFNDFFRDEAGGDGAK
eukprot:g2447.t1